MGLRPVPPFGECYFHNRLYRVVCSVLVALLNSAWFSAEGWEGKEEKNTSLAFGWIQNMKVGCN